jgi:hypothetical protein
MISIWALEFTWKHSLPIQPGCAAMNSEIFDFEESGGFFKTGNFI